MSLSPSLVADLDRLVAHGDHPQLTESIELLENAALLHIDSLMGWTVTIMLDGRPVTLTSIQPLTVDTDTVRASLRVPFLPEPGGGANIVVLYASQQGAFRVFAVDVAGALHLGTDELEVDGDLVTPLVPGLTGVAEWCAVNRAAGVLLDQGIVTTSADVVDLEAYRIAKNLVNN